MYKISADGNVTWIVSVKAKKLVILKESVALDNLLINVLLIVNTGTLIIPGVIPVILTPVHWST